MTMPLLVLTLLLSATSTSPQAIVFTHVTVVDVAARDEARALRPDQTVVVSGERIVAVVANGRLLAKPELERMLAGVEAAAGAK